MRFDSRRRCRVPVVVVRRPLAATMVPVRCWWRQSEAPATSRLLALNVSLGFALSPSLSPLHPLCVARSYASVLYYKGRVGAHARGLSVVPTSELLCCW